MLSFAQEQARDATGSIVGHYWIGLLICDHCRRFVRQEGPTFPTPDALPTVRQLLLLRQAAREEGWSIATTRSPGDYCEKCVLLWRPPANEPSAGPPASCPALCENCGTSLSTRRRKFCCDKCEAESRGDRISLVTQEQRERPRRCPCGALFRHDATRGPVPLHCPLCRRLRKRH